MTPWKPVALVSMCACVMSVGYNVAQAAPASPAPAVNGAQPHMESALSALQNAKNDLSLAEHDKGGWRAGALAGVERAITQTQKGIAAGNK